MTSATSSEASTSPPSSGGGSRPSVGVAKILHAALEAVAPDTVGTMLGPYRLDERIGEGGFSTVWRAAQLTPVRRQVAVKILKHGLDTEEWTARFAVELQALAVMDHPNIARVFDAGATAKGRPFFVMELVRGDPITRFCDAQRLSIPDRLRLFATICRAVQNAHQKGVIHRDLKPSNILVARIDGQPRPTIIDFGIAKAAESVALADPLATQRLELLGTPAYISPEQLARAGRDIDTRVDIYGLGALLYELLCGSAPFDSDRLLGLEMDEMRRLIREVDPPRPSARFSSLPADRRDSIAHLRAATSDELNRALRLDLDWIAMRCLEKDRARRYATADALAADLDRHLAHEPVEARPLSTVYCWRKRVRRHRGTFAAILVIATVLVAGAGASTWQAIRATQAERRAEAHAQTLRRRNYATDMLLAQQALARDDLGQVWKLLDRQRPAAGESDLRGWEWRYLWQFCRGDVSRVLNDQPLLAENIAVSADGQWLATATHESASVEIWNIHSGERRRIPYAATPAAEALVAFSPTAPLLAVHFALGAAGRSGVTRVILWNYEDDQIENSYDLPHRKSGGRGLLAFSSDGARLLAALGTDPAIISVTDGAVLHRLENPWMGCIAATPDLESVAFERGNNSVQVRDLARGTTQVLRSVATEYVNALAFSADGGTLATAGGGTDAVIRLWSLPGGQPAAVLTGHHVAVQRMFFRPDGRSLVSAAHDQTIRVWDLTPGSCSRVLRGHRAGLFDVAPLGESSQLITAARDGTLRLWDPRTLATDHSSRTLSSPAASWRFAADGSLLALNQQGELSRLRPPGYGETESLTRLGSEFVHGWDNRVCLAARQPWVAVVTADRRAQVWDWAAGRLLYERKPAESPGPPLSLAGFIDDDRQLLLHFGDNKSSSRGLVAWHLDTPASSRSWPYPTAGEIPATSVSSDGRWCLTSWNANPFSTRVGDMGPAMLVDLAQGSVNPLPGAVQWWSRTAAFSAAMSSITIPWSRTSSTWQLTPPPQRLAAPPPALCAAYSPDGARLILGSLANNTIGFCDPVLGEQLLALTPAHASVARVEFSPNGDVLVAQTQFGILHLWSAPTWSEIAAAEKSDLPWIIRAP